MKRGLYALLLSLLMLSGCSHGTAPEAADNEATAEDSSGDTTQEQLPESADSFRMAGTGSDTLVVYFSRAGNIEPAEDIDAVSSASLNEVDGEICGNAEMIAGYARDTVGGDLLFIRTAEKYPADYDENTRVASDEMAAEERPELNMGDIDLSGYKNIVLVYPVWWGTIPMPVASFLEGLDSSDKNIIPICTDEGSGIKSSIEDIKELVPGANVLDGISIRGKDAADSASTVEDYLFEVKQSLG